MVNGSGFTVNRGDSRGVPSKAHWLLWSPKGKQACVTKGDLAWASQVTASPCHLCCWAQGRLRQERQPHGDRPHLFQWQECLSLSQQFRICRRPCKCRLITVHLPWKVPSGQPRKWCLWNYRHCFEADTQYVPPPQSFLTPPTSLRPCSEPKRCRRLSVQSICMHLIFSMPGPGHARKWSWCRSDSIPPDANSFPFSEHFSYSKKCHREHHCINNYAEII